MPGCLLPWSVIPCGMGEDIFLVLHRAGTFVTPRASLVTQLWDGLWEWQHLQTWCWQRVPCWGTNVMLFLQGKGKEEKPWECQGVPCFDTNSPGSPWACHKVLLKGNSLQGCLQAHYGIGPTPALYRQNSWGKNRAELWESACSCSWIHCHQNTDQLKWKCYSLP